MESRRFVYLPATIFIVKTVESQIPLKQGYGNWFTYFLPLFTGVTTFVTSCLQEYLLNKEETVTFCLKETVQMKCQCCFGQKQKHFWQVQPSRQHHAHVFGQMWTAKAQISLHICPFLSGPSLSTSRIIVHYKMFQWRANTQKRLCTCTGWCELAHFAHDLRHLFAWRGPPNCPCNIKHFFVNPHVPVNLTLNLQFLWNH